MSNVVKWYAQSGPDGDVVVSTRVRLARNLAHTPFPATLSADGRREVADNIRRAAQALPDQHLTYLDMANTPAIEAQSMVERHLVSPEFAQCLPGSALLLSDDESISLMVNEEDHLRLQVMRPGLALEEAYRLADELDTLLDASLHFAFDDRLGYLTQCPTNLGTGMRASLMLHLPALQERGALPALANTVSKLGLTIRGLYGEGSQSEGALYQLSNQVSLGITEQEAIQNLAGIARQIIQQERTAREQWRDDPRYEDRIWRSLGVLRTARLLSHREFMELISPVRAGVALGLIPGLSLDTISALIADAQPATIMAAARQELDPSQRDQQRAALARTRLNV